MNEIAQKQFTQGELIKYLSRACIQRLNALKVRGVVTRDKAALEFMCGAVTAITALGAKDSDGKDFNLDMFLHVVAIRGVDWVKECAEG